MKPEEIRGFPDQLPSPDEKAMIAAKKRWDRIAKPLHSLGKLEDLTVQIAGIQGSPEFCVNKKAVIEICADHGVVAEGVTQTDQSVTAIVSENFLRGETTACIMAKSCGADVLPFDVGMAVDTAVRTDYKIKYGTADMAHGPAMSYSEARKGIEAGISIAKECKEKGYRILAAGEMGIGNTTACSAVTSVILERPAEEVTGRGAGLSSSGLMRKIEIVGRAIRVNAPNPKDPVDVLAKVGGLDLAALAGLYLGGACERIPVVMDGFISDVAALIAARLCPSVRDFLIPSHISREPAARLILKELNLSPILQADMSLGEGTGAIALFPLLDMAERVYREMKTFDEIKVEQYRYLI
ncbi:MAG: nicotinate-nucleotide--dimethylbenzimidazole phosphoribosyltransferase [Blautia sp.]|nr:nicotinate-nucleotide--dimethylbenzimidazole phosphoribosyltransferase [Blautia sp.]